ncbi:MAG: HAMP domain-containing sensor histidine kinase [Polyangiales bacterium]
MPPWRPRGPHGPHPLHPHDHPFHGHGPHCAPPRRGSVLGWYLRAAMRRRLFVAFAGAIVVTGLVVTGLLTALSDAPTWREEQVRLATFAGGRFAAVWDDAPRRDELSLALARDLDVDLTLTDARGVDLASFSPAGRSNTPACLRPALTFEAGVRGDVRVCTERHRSPRGGRNTLVGLGVAVAVLWTMAGLVARRLTRPLTELVRVVEAIGQGKLESRMQLGRHDAGELGAIAHAVNEMAARIERQIDEQRDLLAAVSHEIRSPLARLRFLLETLRDGDAARERALDEVDREVGGIDALVGDLLAASRMDFGAREEVALDASDVAVRALERAGLDASLLAVEGAPGGFRGDATLVQAALGNLLGNAARHGGRATALRVSRAEGAVRFAVEDDGAGFAAGDEARAFEPFYQGREARQRGGVGMGLALVARIAKAHGGGAKAENLPGGGARVTVWFAA